MKLSPMAALAVATGIATAAFAHQGVQNPAVLARMNNMTDMGDSVETLVHMARGERAFDSARANQAILDLHSQSSEIVPLFETRAEDPASDARDVIWRDFDDFSARATHLVATAEDLTGQIETPDDLRPALQAIGAACSGCHDIYREE